MKNISLLFLLAFFFFVVNNALAQEIPSGQKGIVTGTLIGKGSHWIEVRAAGGGVNRYVPFGGMPEDGKDYDGKIVDQIREIPVDSRVELNWEFQRYFRIAKIKLLPKKNGG